VDSRGWSAVVDVVLGDACDFSCPGLPPAGSVDVVTFSYALSMIPDWRQAIRNAFRLLKIVKTFVCRFNFIVIEFCCLGRAYCGLRLHGLKSAIIWHGCILAMGVRT